MSVGYDMIIEQDFVIVVDVDLIVILVYYIYGVGDWGIDEWVLQVVWDVVNCGVWVFSVCSGVFVFVEVGVFDGC